MKLEKDPFQLTLMVVDMGIEKKQHLIEGHPSGERMTECEVATKSREIGFDKKEHFFS